MNFKELAANVSLGSRQTLLDEESEVQARHARRQELSLLASQAATLQSRVEDGRNAYAILEAGLTAYDGPDFFTSIVRSFANDPMNRGRYQEIIGHAVRGEFCRKHGPAILAAAKIELIEKLQKELDAFLAEHKTDLEEAKKLSKAFDPANPPPLKTVADIPGSSRA